MTITQLQSYHQMIDVPRLSKLSVNEFNESFVRRRLPVVITDAARHWPAMQKWDLKWFRTEHGNRPVKRRGEKTPILLSEHIDALSESSFEHPVPYLRNLNLQTEWPEIVPDVMPRIAITEPDWLSDKMMPTGWPRVARHLNQFFISGRGTTIPLHFDEWMMHAFITNISGEKEFTMYPPEQTPYLYPSDAYYPVSRFESPYNVDLAKYPLFSQATPVTVMLGPGESIFVPCGWWHTTRTHSSCISISSNFVNRHNWWAFREEMLAMRTRLGHDKHRIVTTGIGVYLALLGTVFQARERLHRTH